MPNLEAEAPGSTTETQAQCRQVHKAPGPPPAQPAPRWVYSPRPPSQWGPFLWGLEPCWKRLRASPGPRGPPAAAPCSGACKGLAPPGLGPQHHLLHFRSLCRLEQPWQTLLHSSGPRSAGPGVQGAPHPGRGRRRRTPLRVRGRGLDPGSEEGGGIDASSEVSVFPPHRATPCRMQSPQRPSPPPCSPGSPG